MKKKKKKVTRRIGRGDSVDSLVMGGEPVWKDADKLTPEEQDSKVLKALNWYSYSCDDKEYKPWTIDWMSKSGFSKQDIRHAVNNDDITEFRRIGAYCRISNLGGPLRKDTIDMVKKVVEYIVKIGKIKTPKAEPTKEKVNVQERIRNKTVEYVGILNARIDDIFDAVSKDDKANINHEGWLKNHGIKAVHWPRLSQELKPYIKELKLAYSGKDQDLKEAFSFLGKKKIRILLNTLEDFKQILDG